MRVKGLTGGLFVGKKGKALTPTEATVSKSIEDFLNAHRIYNDRLNSGRIEAVTKYFEKKTQRWKEFRKWVYLCKKGTPDRYFVISGRIYFVEVKRIGGELSQDQIDRHAELRHHGCVVFVADSLDSFIKQFTDHFTKKTPPATAGGTDNT